MTNTVIIGAGQAGLAMSRCLSDLGIDHVVLERGQVAERWRTHGWDSLRLLTPNWMTRLPGYSYDGPDPDGFMSTSELTVLLDRYAQASRAPVVTGTTVRRLTRHGGRFLIETDRGDWQAASVVVATGYNQQPHVPAIARHLPASVTQIVPASYRAPGQLPPGGVLVVGASATGVQLADEIQRSGRQVTLAVGRHIRLPRRYRGRDILWWLDRLGVLGQDVRTIHGAERRRPSLQLVGRLDHRSLDADSLTRTGVRLAGRVQGIDGPRVRFADDLIATTAAADIKLAEALMRIDALIAAARIDADPAEPFMPTWPHSVCSPASLDLERERIATVVWATGYRRSYPWLQLPVFDRHGEIVHTGGVTREPGLYVLGLEFQRRRNSSLIDGVGNDARELADHIAWSRRRIA